MNRSKHQKGEEEGPKEENVQTLFFIDKKGDPNIKKIMQANTDYRNHDQKEKEEDKNGIVIADENEETEEEFIPFHQRRRITSKRIKKLQPEKKKNSTSKNKKNDITDSDEDSSGSQENSKVDHEMIKDYMENVDDLNDLVSSKYQLNALTLSDGEDYEDIVEEYDGSFYLDDDSKESLSSSSYDSIDDASDEEHIKKYDKYGNKADWDAVLYNDGSADDYDDFDDNFVLQSKQTKKSKSPKKNPGKFSSNLPSSSSATQPGKKKSKQEKKLEKREIRQTRKNAANTGLEIRENLTNAKGKTLHKEALSILEKFNFDIKKFLDSEDEQTFLPPTPSNVRNLVKILADRYKLKSKIQGSAKRKVIILFKNKNSIAPTNWQTLPKQIVKDFGVKKLNKRDGVQKNKTDPNFTKKSAATPKVGQSVGATANPIATSNVGHQMLMSMGWTPGTGLGADNNQGIVNPIDVMVRSKRAGLGDT